MTTGVADIHTTRAIMATPMSIWIIQVNHQVTPDDRVASPTLDPGKYAEREIPNLQSRNFEERGFTVGIGG
jgi:hypothetical protein